MKRIILSIVLFASLSCKEDTSYKVHLNDPELFQAAVKNLTDIVVYDIFSPPVASRVYLYPCVAAYEVARQEFPKEYQSLVGQIKELQSIPLPQSNKIDFSLAALYAFNKVGRALIFSENKMDAFEEKFQNQLDKINVPNSVNRISRNYGEQVADHT